jgi:hypothetical protein
MVPCPIFLGSAPPWEALPKTFASPVPDWGPPGGNDFNAKSMAWNEKTPPEAAGFAIFRKIGGEAVWKSGQNQEA